MLLDMYQAIISTPLGRMIAVGDDKCLYQLQFEDKFKSDSPIGRAHSIDSIENELQLYFEGKLKEFKTPLSHSGTPFQQKVWNALKDIPYGDTCSYLDLAKAIEKPKASRAVGTANGANCFPIIIPCHRVINANGALGGYSCGLYRKRWLLDYEKSLKVF